MSLRLKDKYNLREATVELERCDKIWETMQLLKKMQTNCNLDDNLTGDCDAGKDIKPTVPMTIPYIKYEPIQGNGNNALPNFYLSVKSQRKVYHCITCGRQFNEKRGLTIHCEKDHGIAKQDFKKNCNPMESKATVLKTQIVSVMDKKMLSSSNNRVPNLKSNSIAVDQKPGFNHETQSCKIEGATNQRKSRADSSDNSKVPNIKWNRNRYPVKQEDWEGLDAKSLRANGYALVYRCKRCDQTYSHKKSLTKHAYKKHGIRISKMRAVSRKPGQVRSEQKHFVREVVAFDKSNNNVEQSAKVTKEHKREPQKTHKVIVRKLSQRTNIIRPQRACATNTCYTEIAKDGAFSKKYNIRIKPELLESASSNNRSTVTNSSPVKCERSFTNKTSSPSSTQGDECFLCKRPFAQLRKHLKDYHRINSPESILSLPTQVIDQNETDPSVCKAKVEDIRSNKSREGTSKKKSKYRQRYRKRLKEMLKEANEPVDLKTEEETTDDPLSKYIRFSKHSYECLVCRYKFTSRSAVLLHLQRYMVNGLMRMHPPWNNMSRSSQEPITNDSIKDPLALMDHAHAPVATPAVNSIKRSIESLYDQLTTSLERLVKRQKIEVSESDGDLANIVSDSASDSAHQLNAERESVIVLSGSDSRSAMEYDPPNPRNMRDSSDRDSGIGISITIMKRDNSYAIVDKDAISKDDNLSSDSSSDAMTPMDFVKDDQEDRRRRSHGSVGGVNYGNENCTMIESTIDKEVTMARNNDVRILKEVPIAVEKNSNTVEEDSIAMEEDPIIVDDDSIVVTKYPSVVTKDPIVVKKDAIVVKDDRIVVEKDSIVVAKDPIVVEDDPIVVEDDPIVVEKDPTVVEDDPIVVAKDPIVVEKVPIVVEDDPIVVAKDPIVVEKDPIVVEDDPIVVEKDTIVVANDPIVVEKDSIVVEKGRQRMEGCHGEKACVNNTLDNVPSLKVSCDNVLAMNSLQ